MYDFQGKFEEFERFDERVDRQLDYYVVGALYVGLEDFKRKVKATINSLKRVR